MKKLVKDAGLGDRIEIDSAGITGYHEGDRADSRMRAHAARRGYSLDSISRPVRQWDFHDFDLIIGMDDLVERLRQLFVCPTGYRHGRPKYNGLETDGSRSGIRR